MKSDRETLTPRGLTCQRYVCLGSTFDKQRHRSSFRHSSSSVRPNKAGLRAGVLIRIARSIREALARDLLPGDGTVACSRLFLLPSSALFLCNRDLDRDRARLMDACEIQRARARARMCKSESAEQIFAATFREFYGRALDRGIFLLGGDV